MKTPFFLHSEIFMRVRQLLFSAFVGFMLTALVYAAPAADKIQALIVTGIDYPGHHWWETTPVLQEELAKDPRIQVEVFKDPFYICLTGDKPVVTLATARSKITKRDHPMAFVHRYGRGRVFFTPLGHDAKALRAPGTAELLRRAVAWAAGRPPTEPASSATPSAPPRKPVSF